MVEEILQWIGGFSHKKGVQNVSNIQGGAGFRIDPQYVKMFDQHAMCTATGCWLDFPPVGSGLTIEPGKDTPVESFFGSYSYLVIRDHCSEN